MQCAVRRFALGQRTIRFSNSTDRYAIIHRYFSSLQVQPLTRPPTLKLHRLELKTRISTTLIRYYANASKDGNNPSDSESKNEGQQKQSSSKPKEHPDHPENWSPFYRRLANALPHAVRKRPTREDFLKVAEGFWARARIRFKWFTIRSFRRFGTDDVFAFFTWFLMSQTLWIFVGT
jgi:mitochondrial distribution and morphology protein 31